MKTKQPKSGKFCGAAVGELPRGDKCLMCDMFAKVFGDDPDHKQLYCPLDAPPVQLYRLKGRARNGH